MDEAIKTSDLEGFRSAFDAKREHIVAMHAAVQNGLNASCHDEEAVRSTRHQFSIQIPSGKVTNQKKSGRCWMFSALNVMRLEVMKKCALEDFELSQSYPLFWDKLEKANWLLESIIDTKDEPLDGRLVSYLLQAPMNDGGQWDMFVALVEKYGVVPKDAMPESAASSETRELDKYLTLKLREFACILRTAYEKDGYDDGKLRAMKDDMLKTIYRILSIALGRPPVSFTWEATGKDGGFVCERNITPKQFFDKYVSLQLDDYVSLINAPTSDKPYGKTYTVRFLGNVKGGRAVKYLNLPVSRLKEAALAQLKSGEVVWFGSDVGQFSERKAGLMDLKALDVAGLLDTNFPLTKAQRLDYGESRMTHAMVLTGVDLDEEGKPLRWKVENSWGEDVGDKGYFVMTDDWFSEFTYQVVVNKKFLTETERKLFAQKPVELQPWDPMGSLA